MRYDYTNVAPPVIMNGTGKCGGFFFTRAGLMSSPSYPNIYPENIDCIYTIAQANGTAILLTFHAMDIGDKDSFLGLCLHDYLEIRDGTSEDSPLIEKLCDENMPPPIKSTGHNVWIR